MVLTMSVHVVPPLVEVCHFVTFPVLPVKLIIPVFEAPHTVGAEVEVAPPIDGVVQVGQVGAVKVKVVSLKQRLMLS